MNKYLYIFILSLLSTSEGLSQNTQTVRSASQTELQVPRLVVNIVIDQLRSDYLTHNMSVFGGSGLRRLMSQGLVYRNAGVPFLPVDRASATAALVTATTPFYNGIPSSEWVSRKTARPISCIADNVSLLTPRGNDPVPTNLLVSTVGDQLKIATNQAAKVVGVAIHSDAAIMLAGHCADAALWIDPVTGICHAASYYNRRTIDPSADFNRQQVAQRKKLTTASNNRIAKSVTMPLTQSPLVNGYITDLALHTVNSLQMGVDDTPDMLSVMYYAGARTVSATATPAEITEVYKSVDNAVSTLVSSIEQRVGKDKVLFVVSSTGYYDEPAVDYAKYNVPSGTVFINRTANLLNMYLSAIYGQAHYVEAFKDEHIYLDHKLIERKKLRLNEVLERSREMLIMSDGIRNAYTSFNLASASDSRLTLIRNGYNTDVCGDIILDVAPGWKVLNEETKQQRQWKQYSFEFPIIFYGAGAKRETVLTPVTIDQIAPTISRHLRIRAPDASTKASLY